MASQKAIVSGISGRYALAFFDLAVETKSLDVAEADVSKLKSLIKDSADFKDLVSSPLYSSGDQISGVAAVAVAVGLSDITAKFLGVLATNRRLNVLSKTIRDFDKLVSDQRGEVSADVVSADELTATQLKELTKQLKNAVGQDVTINASVDESLLGGLVVKVGSRMIDSSIKTKLDNLRVAMKGVQ